MNNNLQGELLNIGDKFIAFLPNLLAGILFIILGIFLGWLAKRIIIQLALALRLERILISFKWGEDFAKGDVRYGLYNFLGNVTYLIVFLIFLDDALNKFNLTVLSNLIRDGIVFIPKIIIAILIFGIGSVIATWATRAVQRVLWRENIPRATLISRFAKAMLLIFFSAMAIAELNIAREIVVIAFATVFITLGLLIVVFAYLGGRELVTQIKNPPKNE